ncbi:MAG TPA: thioredoxin [Dehalococcoidia bacterium]|nr:thioredoxin [Dehalococcoidia bacterium]
MAKPSAVETSTFEAEVLKAEVPVLVDFWAEWCGPCKMIAPLLDQLADEYEGKVRFTKVDVDAYPELANRYGVRAIPTLLIFRDGTVATQVVGAQPKTTLKRHIEAILQGA